MKKKNSLINSIAAAPHVFWSVLFIVLPLIIVVYDAFTDADGEVRHFAVSISGKDRSLVCQEYP